MNGAVASSKPRAPIDVTQPAPKECFSRLILFTLIPKAFVIKEITLIKKPTKKAGIKPKGLVLFLCYYPPLLFFIFPTFSLINKPIS